MNDVSAVAYHLVRLLTNRQLWFAIFKVTIPRQACKDQALQYNYWYSG